MPNSTLREVSRHAARRRIAELALALFIERGYSHTTVEDIAHAAGISERTFFRYFSAKDEVLFAWLESETANVVESIHERPADEAPWATLREVFDAVLDQLDEKEVQERARLFQAITTESPQVLAVYLARVNAFQQALGTALWERWEARDGDSDPDVPFLLRALVGAVIAVLNEAALSSGDRTIAERRELIHTALDALRPAREDLSGPA